MDENINARVTDEASQESVPSVQAVVHNFHPSYSAHSGGSVVAPSIIGSNVGNININILTATQESVGSLKEALNSEKTVGSRLKPRTDKITECQQKLKSTLKKKFSHFPEGMEADKSSLDRIYTELYITKGGSGEVNQEHEVRQMEAASRVQLIQDRSIHCNQMFDPPPGREDHIRTVVTRGVAGIGKTVSVNKFSLDWAEDRANTNLSFVFPLTFRELNLMNNKALSLVELLSVFFPEVKDVEIFGDEETQMLVILDGLDESRFCLDFHSSEIMSDVTQITQISVILTNLIRGRLLPSSLLWITSRPAASGQIPLEFIDLLTEVRGFNNPQKDQYFRKKISDQNLANRVIAHVKSCRSLHIMCHIPIFCWMATSVLEKKLLQEDRKDLPQTLTQMYIHFLSLYVETMKKRSPGGGQPDVDSMRSNLLSLGKLAFHELEEGHLIFYEKDLRQNGINVSQASMFSGIYTQIFSQEATLCEEKMFCFVHLSVQEFFAALYVFLMFHNHNQNVLLKKSSSSWRLFRESSELILYKEAVEKALRCGSGRFDIFLRFLLGLSLESNQKLLKHLMTNNRTHQRTRAEVIKHIKEKIRMSPSADRSINLFHCLNELHDHSLVEEIQSFLRSESLSRVHLSPAQWSTLVFVLLTSEEQQPEFNLSSYSRSEEGLLRLQPVIRTAQIANLSSCNLSVTCSEILNNIISSSELQHLDLSSNKLTDAGLMHISDALKNSKLETLRLKSCSLTENSCDCLASILTSAACQLRELDLSDNDLQDEGVLRFCGGLESLHCKLEILSLSLCRVTEDGCTFLASALNSSRLKELDLSYNHPGSSGLMLLSALLEDRRCSLEKLSVDQCGESRIQPGVKKYSTCLTLNPDSAHQDLCLSEGNRRSTRWTRQIYPDHPDRFHFWTQVLCMEGLTGRCYWEVEWSGRVEVGVAYRRMNRKGEGPDSWLGRNDSSWALSCSSHGYRALHSNSSVSIPGNPASSRVGVYLDWSAGSLSFYSSGSLLHTFNTCFTQPLFPGFHLGWVDSTVYLC